MLTAVNRTGEFVGMPYRHGPEPGSRLPTHPPSRSVQSGERRASPSDPSTESMRRTRPRFGAARGYGPPASNFATSSGSRPGPPHGAFPSMAGFPGSVGAAPPGPFQPSGPPGASGEQQMPLPAPPVSFLFTQESSVGLTGLLRAGRQLQPGMGSNSNMGRGTLLPDTMRHNLLQFSAPPAPADSLRSPSILRPNPSAFLSLLPDLNAPCTHPFSAAVRQGMSARGANPTTQPAPAHRNLSRARPGYNSTYSTTRDGRSNAHLIAEVEAQLRAETFGPASSRTLGGPQVVRERLHQQRASSTSSLAPQRGYGHPQPQLPQNARGEAGEPPQKRRRSGSFSEGKQ